MRSLIRLSLCLILVSPFTAARGDDRPNLLVLLADDVSWKDFGCYGHPTIRTPNIDRLAAAGLKFNNAFLTTSQCSPTRISVLTGKYPHATGAEDLHMPLPDDEVFVSSDLKKSGYFTGHMRKTHYGPNGNRQFDWYSQQLEDFPKFLDAAEGQPFFMWVGFRDAHRPYQPNTIARPHESEEVVVPPYMADTPETRDDLALYYDEVSRMDENIGRFVDELRERDLLDNTCIVFFADNGRPFPRCKGTVYDSGIGTPLVFHWPAKIDAGEVCDGMVSVVDLAPTFCELAGLQIPARMQGQSLTEMLGDPTSEGREYVFSERNWHNCDEHIRSVRTRRWKLICNAYLDLPFGSPADVSRSPSWLSLKELNDAGQLLSGQAALFRTPRPRYELYDLEADPDELNNLAESAEHQAAIERLAAVLDQWRSETDDFPPHRRRRADNTDRVTGVKFTKKRPPLMP